MAIRQLAADVIVFGTIITPFQVLLVHGYDEWDPFPLSARAGERSGDSRTDNKEEDVTARQTECFMPGGAESAR